MTGITDEQGFTLIELMTAIIILGIVLAPLLNFFVNSAKIAASAGEQTVTLNIAQGKMEEYLDYLAGSFSRDDFAVLPLTEGPLPFSGQEEYNYQVNLSLYDANLHLVRVEVEAYPENMPADKVKLVSLKWIP